MKIFAEELRNKEIYSSDGLKLGIIDNLVVDTKTGKVLHILVWPAETVDMTRFRVDSQQRIVLPFNKIKSIKDVVIMAPLSE
ncbi:MAG: PRC-barrel domain-containing protein [Thermoplasmata archaeon]|nr:PRC-barrel domain-containing protein [Thermoplasmata archaeon]RLF71509.1 MAG: PRC-barrel domain protein [Thermoplasmata archaeon]RLF75616.1 MAG: PRC-barrel domain protein [Thermoplasmata archaeon]HDD59535.1 PRC-barrel domain protein [Euryarchaeota archaeon]